MLKPFLILLLCILVMNTAFAQNRDTAIYFIKKSGYLQKNAQGADFMITILPPDTSVNKNLYMVNTYYPSGKIRYISSATSKKLQPIDPKSPGYVKPLLQGQFISFFQNGHKMQIANYENGDLSGDETDYYPNGKIYCTKTHINDKKTIFNSCLDSTGKVLVENGNGKWLSFEDENLKNYFTGNIVNGLPEGDWSGKLDDTINTFKTYKNGELKCDGRYDKLGRKVYSKVDVNPEYPGGLEGFYRFLGTTIRYPPDARDMNIQGTVVITFIVDENGILGGLFVAKSVSPDIDQEAIRVIALSPKWKPGVYEGKMVPVMYSVPIGFTLSNAK